MPQIRRTLQAEEDLLEIWRFIALDQQHPQAAEKVLRDLDEAVTRIATLPTIGEAVPRLRPRLRMFPQGNHIIFYEPIDDGILVLRVMHGARDWEKLIR